MNASRPDIQQHGVDVYDSNGESPSPPHPAHHADADHHSRTPVNYSPRTRGGVIFFAVVVAIALIVAFALVHRNRAAAQARLAEATIGQSRQSLPVDVLRIGRASAAKLLTLPGNTQAFYETTLFARTSGYLHNWVVDIGDRVKAGAPLAYIDTPELDDQLRGAKSKLNELAAEAEVADASLKFAQVSADRWSKGAPDGVVSAQESDQKQSELVEATAKLKTARAAVELGNTEVQRLETLEKFKTVVAPFDGVITRRQIDIGDLVTAGSTSNTTPLFSIAQSNQIRVFVEVPQVAVGDIRVGMPASVIVGDLGSETFPGTVDRTANSLDSRSRTLKVEVLVNNPRLELLPGMYVQVVFETSRKDPPLKVPPSALTFGAGGSAQVAVVSSDGHVSFHPITIARDLGTEIEVGSGLKDGDAVALNVGNQVVNGEKVDPHYVAEESPAPAMSVPPATGPAMTTPGASEPATTFPSLTALANP